MVHLDKPPKYDLSPSYCQICYIKCLESYPIDLRDRSYFGGLSMWMVHLDWYRFQTCEDLVFEYCDKEFCMVNFKEMFLNMFYINNGNDWIKSPNLEYCLANDQYYK